MWVARDLLLTGLSNSLLPLRRPLHTQLALQTQVAPTPYLVLPLAVIPWSLQLFKAGSPLKLRLGLQERALLTSPAAPPWMLFMTPAILGVFTANKAALAPVAFPGLSQCHTSEDLFDPVMLSTSEHRIWTDVHPSPHTVSP